MYFLAGNGNNAHLRFSVTNHSINSYDTIQSTRSISLQNSNTNMFKRRPWLKLAIVIIVVLVLAGISAAVTVLVLRNKPGKYVNLVTTYIAWQPVNVYPLVLGLGMLLWRNDNVICFVKEVKIISMLWEVFCLSITKDYRFLVK